MGTYTFTGGDPYAGLTFSTQNYTTAYDESAWKWGPQTGGGPGNNGEAMVRTYEPSNSQDVAVFQEHIEGAGVAPTESGGFVIYESPSNGTTDRSENAIRLALNWTSSTSAEIMAEDTWYAVALPSTFVPDVGSDVGPRCIVAQIHDNANNPLNIVLRDAGSGTGLYVNYEDALDVDHYFELVAPGTFSFNTEYQIVWGWRIGSTDVDACRFYINGTLVHDEDDGLSAQDPDYNIFFRSAEYLKHGIYWTQQTGTDIDNLQHKIRISGYGQFSGVDAIAAALIRVAQT